MADNWKYHKSGWQRFWYHFPNTILLTSAQSAESVTKTTLWHGQVQLRVWSSFKPSPCTQPVSVNSPAILINDVLNSTTFLSISGFSGLILISLPLTHCLGPCKVPILPPMIWQIVMLFYFWLLVFPICSFPYFFLPLWKTALPRLAQRYLLLWKEIRPRRRKQVGLWDLIATKSPLTFILALQWCRATFCGGGVGSEKEAVSSQVSEHTYSSTENTAGG